MISVVVLLERRRRKTYLGKVGIFIAEEK